MYVQHGVPSTCAAIFVEDRRDPVIGRAIPARHHARPFERADLAARDAHADIADPFRRQRLVTARRVGEEGIAAVDHDVVRFEMGRELLDHLVDRPPGLHHDDDGARPLEAGDEIGQLAGGEKPPFAPMLRDKLVRSFGMPVEERHAETLAGRVAREIGAHDRQTHHADVRQIRHMFSPFASPRGARAIPRTPVGRGPEWTTILPFPRRQRAPAQRTGQEP